MHAAHNDFPHDIAIRANLNTTYSDTGVPVEVRAQQWLDKHPKIYSEFKRYAWEAMMAGCTRVGAKAIAERVRWDFKLYGGKKMADFKVNNIVVTYMARKLAQEEPAFEKMFEFRNRKCKNDDEPQKGEVKNDVSY